MSITKQEYFDKTIRHLVEQGERASDGISCRFLTPDGLKCAVGCHIPDGHEAQESGDGVGYLEEVYLDLAGIAWPDTDDGISLAEALQSLHDISENWDESGFVGWDAAYSIAYNFGLDSSVVKELLGAQ